MVPFIVTIARRRHPALVTVAILQKVLPKETWPDGLLSYRNSITPLEKERQKTKSDPMIKNGELTNV